MRPGIATIKLAAAAVAICAAGCSGGKRLTWERIFGPPPAKQVAMAFDVNDPDTRREGIVALSKTRRGLREPHLRGYATILGQDPEASVRGAAVRALGRAGDQKYLGHVVRALSDKSETVRWDAALALAELRGPSAEKPLRTHALDDPAADVRGACAQTLRHYYSGEVMRTLVMCLDDKSLAVRHYAHESLVKLAGIDMGTEAGAWRSVLHHPLVGPPRGQSRPWWDLFNRTRRGRKVPAEAPTTAPKPNGN